MGKSPLYLAARGIAQALRQLGAHLEAGAIREAMARFPVGNAEQSPSYSQHGEDRLLLRIFGGQGNGTALEVGGFDGVTFSNTLLFEQLGWRTMIVEPMPEFARKIRGNRRAELFECAAGSAAGTAAFTVAKGAESLSTFHPAGAQLGNMNFHGAVAEQITVPIRTLDEMLETAGVERLDFVTIDVEGHEVEALRGFTLKRWNPAVVMIEDNSRGVDHEVRDAMRQQGYARFMTTACNDWYAQRSNPQLISTRVILGDRLRFGYCRFLAFIERFGHRRSASSEAGPPAHGLT